VIHPEPGWVPAYQELRAKFRRLASIVHPGEAEHVYP
jgi:hypothetical protein